MAKVKAIAHPCPTTLESLVFQAKAGFDAFMDAFYGTPQKTNRTIWMALSMLLFSQILALTSGTPIPGVCG